MTLARMLLRASGICQTNLTSWLERLRQLSFQEINLEKMIFIFKKMSQTLHQARSTKKKSIPIL